MEFERWVCRWGRGVFAVGALLASGPAWAYIWFGNPVEGVIGIDRPEHDLVSATGTVTALRMHACAGGYTDYAVGQSLDLTVPLSVDIDAGSWCGASVRWGSSVTLVHSGWTAVYSEPYTAVAVDENPEVVSAVLTPFTVTAGTFSGNAPRLVIEVHEL